MILMLRYDSSIPIDLNLSNNGLFIAHWTISQHAFTLLLLFQSTKGPSCMTVAPRIILCAWLGKYTSARRLQDCPQSLANGKKVGCFTHSSCGFPTQWCVFLRFRWGAFCRRLTSMAMGSWISGQLGSTKLGARNLLKNHWYTKQNSLYFAGLLSFSSCLPLRDSRDWSFGTLGVHPFHAPLPGEAAGTGEDGLHQERRPFEESPQALWQRGPAGGLWGDCDVRVKWLRKMFVFSGIASYSNIVQSISGIKRVWYWPRSS